MALERLDRPETLIAVIGEFKQGKSSLVNALLGEEAAPVDDDLSTAALTLFRYGPEPRAAVVRRSDEGEVREDISAEGYRAYSTEQHNRDNVLGVERVEVQLPNEFLASGAVLVDTPGAGGIAPGYGGMTLAYLRSVDAVIFVSDASAPLSRPEIEFLARAAQACPAVVMALTKNDLYPAWREMEAVDKATLEAAGIDVPVLPVSSELMAYGRTTANASIQAQSGVPALADVLTSLVVDASRMHACRRGLDETLATIAQLRAVAAIELAALEDPAGMDARIRELETSKARLEYLRGPGARWAQVLGDGFADLIGETEHRFRRTMREVARSIEDEIEAGGDPGRKWDELSGALRERVGAASDRLIADLDEGARAIQTAITSLLADEEGFELAGGRPHGLDAGELWSAKPLDRLGLGKATDVAFSGLRGGQSGISTINLLAGLAGVGVSTLATAGIGFVFVGKQLFDERKRHLQVKRQQARTAVRQFVDDVQFEAGKRMRDVVRDLQRTQRDYFGERIQELYRTATASLAAVQGALQKDASVREASVKSLRERIALFDQLAARVAQVQALL